MAQMITWIVGILAWKFERKIAWGVILRKPGERARRLDSSKTIWAFFSIQFHFQYSDQRVSKYEVEAGIGTRKRLQYTSKEESVKCNSVYRNSCWKPNSRHVPRPI